MGERTNGQIKKRKKRNNKKIKKKKLKKKNLKQEPCTLIQILEVISKVRNEDINTLSQTIYENTNKFLGV